MRPGDRVRHVVKPSEPFATTSARGTVSRVTPAAPGYPAQAYVDWGDYATWEKLSDLRG